MVRLLSISLYLRPGGVHHCGMRLLIRELDGSARTAMFLGVVGNTLRVALPGSDDAVEYRWAGNQWRDESGTLVEIEFDTSEEAFDRSRWLCGLAPVKTTFD
jgi:hypothetical protein